MTRQRPTIYRQANGRPTAARLAGMLVGSIIALCVLAHFILAHLLVAMHLLPASTDAGLKWDDAFLIPAFVLGIGVAFPEELAATARNVSEVIRAWRKGHTGTHRVPKSRRKAP